MGIKRVGSIKVVVIKKVYSIARVTSAHFINL